MRIEFLKLKKSISFWLISFIFIALTLYLLVNYNQSTAFHKNLISYNHVKNENYFLIVLFNSITSYITIFYLSFLSFLLYDVDRQIFNNNFYYNFKIKSYLILFNKIMVAFIIILLWYLLSLSFTIFSIKQIDVKTLLTILPLIKIFAFKFLINTFILITILIILQSLIINRWAYFLFIILNISSLIFINEQYSIYAWYVNSLGFITSVLTKKDLSLIINYNSEYFLIATVLILLVIFTYNEKVKHKQVRPQ